MMIPFWPASPALFTVFFLDSPDKPRYTAAVPMAKRPLSRLRRAGLAAGALLQALALSWLDSRPALGIDSGGANEGNSGSTGPYDVMTSSGARGAAAQAPQTFDLLRQAIGSPALQNSNIGAENAPTTNGGYFLRNGIPRDLSSSRQDGSQNQTSSNNKAPSNGFASPALSHELRQLGTTNPFLNSSGRGALATPNPATSAAQSQTASAAQDNNPSSSQQSQNQAKSLLTFTPSPGLGFSGAGLPYTGSSQLQAFATFVAQSGAKYFRLGVMAPRVIEPLTSSLLAQVYAAYQQGPDSPAMEALVDQLAIDPLWTGKKSQITNEPFDIDDTVTAYTNAGIQLVLAEGVGYANELPSYNGGTCAGANISGCATPSRIGKQQYLALMRYMVGAMVKRLGDRVWIWQIENELNVADSDAAMKAHSPRGWSPTTDPGYADALMRTLADAVHTEGKRIGRKLLTVTSFEGGLSGLASGSWSVNDWGFVKDGTLDILGIDEYPNYVCGQPVNAYQIGMDVGDAKGVANGRPVWIVETGYPTAPTEHCFNLQNQATFFQQAFYSASTTGAQVVMPFGWIPTPQTAAQVSAPGSGASWGGKWGINPGGAFNYGADESHWSPIITQGNTPWINNWSTALSSGSGVSFGPAWYVFKNSAPNYRPGGINSPVVNNQIIGGMINIGGRIIGVGVGALGGLIGNAFCTATPWFEGLLGDFVGDVRWLGSTGYKDLLGFYGDLKSWGGDLGRDLTHNPVAGFFGGVYAGASNAFNNDIGKPATNFFGGVVSGAASLGGSIQNDAQSAAHAAGNALASAGSAVVNFFSGL